MTVSFVTQGMALSPSMLQFLSTKWNSSRAPRAEQGRERTDTTSAALSGVSIPLTRGSSASVTARGRFATSAKLNCKIMVSKI